MKKSKQVYGAVITILVITVVLVGCRVITASPTEAEREQSIILDGVRVSVEGVKQRSHLQNYYLMQYPEEGQTFLEVALVIANLSTTPDVILEWGERNFRLDCIGSQSELTATRRVIANENVFYKSGEKLDFYYVYVFSIPQKTDFNTCNLEFSDGQRLSLGPISTFLASPDGAKNELGAALSGSENQVRGLDAVVSGGSRNAANAVHTTVAGGALNAATASHATVGGGRENVAENFYATIAGGYANSASARDTFVGGGSRNTASEPRSTIGGGVQNQAMAPDTTIAGGAYNQASDNYAAITGGTRNVASGYASVIGGGAGNQASGDQASVVGGLNNRVEGEYGFIGGGYGNWIGGNYAVIPGGFQNQVAGSYSFAAGYRTQILPDHAGTFLFADASEVDFLSTAANEFAVRATGGVRFVTTVGGDGNVISGVQLLPGSGAWSTLSDENLKTGFEPVDPQVILKAVSELPLLTWRYQNQADSIRHIGPTAQSFYAAFGLGEDPRYISTVDADGIALASAQGLYQLIERQQEEIQIQEAYLLELEKRLQVLEQVHGPNDKSRPEIWAWLGWGCFLVFGIWSVRKRSGW